MARRWRIPAGPLLWTLVLLLALAALPSAPQRAEAYQLYGFAWPQRTITYHVQPVPYRAAVDRAARAWNVAAIGVRFRRSSFEEADVVVRYGGARCDGLGDIGFPPSGVSRVTLGANCDTRLITMTAAHEL